LSGLAALPASGENISPWEKEEGKNDATNSRIAPIPSAIGAENASPDDSLGFLFPTFTFVI
jgi:hypothetical protein